MKMNAKELIILSAFLDNVTEMYKECGTKHSNDLLKYSLLSIADATEKVSSKLQLMLQYHGKTANEEKSIATNVKKLQTKLVDNEFKQKREEFIVNMSNLTKGYMDFLKKELALNDDETLSEMDVPLELKLLSDLIKEL